MCHAELNAILNKNVASLNGAVRLAQSFMHLSYFGHECNGTEMSLP